MPQYNNVIYECDSGIGVITLHRPKALNALNYETLQELQQVIYEVSKEEEVRALIITGSGQKAFVAGADIKEMSTMSAIDAKKFSKTGQEVFYALEELPYPVIAAVNGYALGGGCELALACDIRIASETAKFGQPEVGLGITPGFGGTVRLPRLVGKSRAAEMIYTGDVIDAMEAYRIGLVNQVVPAGELLTTAKALAQKIVTRPKAALDLCKKAIYCGSDMDVQKALEYETCLFGLCFATNDQTEGMAAFLEKRQAKFTGK